MKRGMVASSLVTAVVTAVIAAGCTIWPQPGRDHTRRAHNPSERKISAANVATLTEAWATSFAGDLSDPVVHGESVYVLEHGVASHALRALDVTTGAQRWGFSIGPTAAFDAAGPVVVVGSDDVALVVVVQQQRSSPFELRVVGYVARTGAFAFETLVSTGGLPFVGEPLVLGSRVVVGQEVVVPAGSLGSNPTLYCARYRAVDVPGGAVNWHQFRCFAEEWVPAGGIVAATRDDPATTRHATTVVAPGTNGVDVGSLCPGAASFPPCAGDPRFDPVSAASSPIALPGPAPGDDEIAFLEWTAAGSTTLTVRRAADGSPGWQGVVSATHAGVLPPAADDTHVFVPHAGGMTAFPNGCDAPLCPPDWSTVSIATPTAQPVVANGLVFVATSGGLGTGVVYAFPVDGCAEPPCVRLWLDQLLDVPVTSLVVGAGTVLASAETGEIAAYRLPPS